MLMPILTLARYSLVAQADLSLACLLLHDSSSALCGIDNTMWSGCLDLLNHAMLSELHMCLTFVRYWRQTASSVLCLTAFWPSGKGGPDGRRPYPRPSCTGTPH